jgi:hypothetical protein
MFSRRSRKQIRDVLKAKAAMTEIQITKTFYNLFRTLENCGCALKTLRILVIVSDFGFRASDFASYGSIAAIIYPFDFCR